MFIGREAEVAKIRAFLEKPSGSMMIYGKRKVGKTTLINHVLQDEANTAYYECIKDSVKANISGLTDVLVRAKILPARIVFSSFQDLFQYLNSLNGTYNIVIDEYPYLKVTNKAETVDSVFQSVIDNCMGNVRLFLSGSHVGMMKDLLNEKNALYGRFDAVMQLKELRYTDAAGFYPDLSVYDKVALYAVFGGSPFVNEFIDGGKTLRENLVATVLNDSHSVYNYVDHLLVSDFNNAVGAERILSVLANGRKKYGEIEQQLQMDKNGLLSKQLKPLLDMEIVTRTFPINRPDDNKKVSYEINDNSLRFYYAYIYRNKSALQVIGPEAFYEEYVAPSILTFISHRFEELCRDYFSFMVKNGKLRGVRNIGMYYYDDIANRKHGEFDVVLQRTEGFDFYEAKYYKSPLRLSEMEEEEEQVRAIPGLTASRIGFIAASGFESADAKYVCITGEDLYSV